MGFHQIQEEFTRERTRSTKSHTCEESRPRTD